MLVRTPARNKTQRVLGCENVRVTVQRRGQLESLRTTVSTHPVAGMLLYVCHQAPLSAHV